jgi:hypothetical protein
MGDVFSVFDFPGKIVHVPNVAGETNQSDGTWQAASQPATSEITGNVQDLTVRDLQRLPEGEYEFGDRKISTGATLSPGDTLEITEVDQSTTSWLVKARERTSYILPKFGMPLRHVYLLKRRA